MDLKKKRALVFNNNTVLNSKLPKLVEYSINGQIFKFRKTQNPNKNN